MFSDPRDHFLGYDKSGKRVVRAYYGHLRNNCNATNAWGSVFTARYCIQT